MEGRGAWSRVEGSSLGELLPNLAWLLERGALGLGAGGGSSSPPCLHSTGELGSSAGSLSVTIGVRHLAATRKSGITQETEIVAWLPSPRCQIWWAGPKSGAQAKLLVQYPAACNAITFILAQCPHLMHLTTKQNCKSCNCLYIILIVYPTQLIIILHCPCVCNDVWT